MTIASAVGGGGPATRKRERRGNWMAKALLSHEHVRPQQKGEWGAGGGLRIEKTRHLVKACFRIRLFFVDESCLRLPPDRICSGIVNMAPYKDSCLMVLPSAFRFRILFALCL